MDTFNKCKQLVGNTPLIDYKYNHTDTTKELFEENILKLEKNAIYDLMKENLTIERLEYILETGKYLRN